MILKLLNTLLKEFSSDSMKQNFKLSHLLPFFFSKLIFSAFQAKWRLFPALRHKRFFHSVWNTTGIVVIISQSGKDPSWIHVFHFLVILKWISTDIRYLACKKREKKYSSKKELESISSCDITKSSLWCIHACFHMWSIFPSSLSTTGFILTEIK